LIPATIKIIYAFRGRGLTSAFYGWAWLNKNNWWIEDPDRRRGRKQFVAGEVKIKGKLTFEATERK
jgi:hypothetical protein